MNDLTMPVLFGSLTLSLRGMFIRSRSLVCFIMCVSPTTFLLTSSACFLGEYVTESVLRAFPCQSIAVRASDIQFAVSSGCRTQHSLGFTHSKVRRSAACPTTQSLALFLYPRDSSFQRLAMYTEICEHISALFRNNAISCNDA